MGAIGTILIVSTIWVAFLHALAPDHWMPFAALARANKLTRVRRLVITFLAGLGHVGSSIVIALVGIFLGKELTQLQGLELHRGALASLLLIGFGVAYMAWGIKHARHGVNHAHLSVDTLSQAAKAAFITRFWTLFAVMVFGPCEPMIPLIFMAWIKGFSALVATISLFSLVTSAMVMVQSFMAYEGLGFVWERYEARLARHSHTIAGATILAVGLLVVLLDL